jgi:hypothetical protein
LQDRVQLSGRAGDPLQIFMVEHNLGPPRLVVIVQTGPPNRTEDSEKGDREKTDSQHGIKVGTLSTLHAVPYSSSPLYLR